ncbi:macro domain-containing protein [Aeromicrobium tamlense]|uniref:Macro domain-containing protein n=1 Tax=Aeromicrobium tamlense TaxID=375541 RepID=A0A8I0KIX0_9ACTN|nr:macro domain-containing protein [Aeromicrobium tamlense]MBD1270412.1 macro domain-containing protein [Aeromicrobium tamlense]MBD1271456.1 macro domain-containing protein [Aeromicrobium tamlense]NYI37799.1 O-acetyl-ADP-ribose deacetylase (regulator of RNase III) [Aeromicrobium tamlense]
MTRLSAIHADITTLEVDAIVNAANNAMRGGGGVDGAIHAAGGPAVLADCVARFPVGLATGDAGWTTAGDLPARWIIHTVGPNRHAGQTDVALLESCYRRSLEVADDLGAREVAFPLIGAGVYGWSKADSVAAAVRAVHAGTFGVEHVLLVGYDDAARREIEAALD